MQLAYIYDSNGYFLGSHGAQKDPFSDTYLLPKNATFIAPPSVGEHKLAQWDGDSWNEVDDPSYLAEVASQEAADLQSNRLSSWVVYYNKLDDNKVLLYREFVKTIHHLEEIVPRWNGLPMDDPANVDYGYIVLPNDSEPVGSDAKNAYGITLKKIVDNAVTDRDSNDVDVETEAPKWMTLRTLRNELLTSKLDAARNYMLWAEASGASWTSQEKIDWATYRQALLDVPANESDILAADLENYSWPTVPTSPVLPGIND